MNPLRNLLPALIAASGITVAQLYGVGFWIGLFGVPALGWAVSLTWESASVWLWWRGDRTWPHRLAKWAATFALVCGMVMRSAGPLLRQADEANAALAETSPPGPRIRFAVHNGRQNEGTIMEWPEAGSFVLICNTKTLREYDFNCRYTKGVRGQDSNWSLFTSLLSGVVL